MTTDQQPTAEERHREETQLPFARRYAKPLLLLVIVAVAASLWVGFKDYVDLQYLSMKEAELRAFQADHPFLVYGVAFFVYVVMAGLSLPGAAALSLLYAWYFGFVPGVVLVSFSSTAGATTAFLLSRHFFRDAVLNRFGERLQTFQEQLRREGAFYLFWLRLIPLFPFFVINLVMGLTPMRTRTFWWVSQLGMLPGTVLYVYAGSRVPSLGELARDGVLSVLSGGQLLQLAIAFGALGAVPLVLKRLFERRTNPEVSETAD